MHQPLQRVNGTGVPAGSSPERPPGFKSSRVAFRFQGTFVERDEYGTKTGDTPRAESAANDPPKALGRLHGRLLCRALDRGRRDGASVLGSESSSNRVELLFLGGCLRFGVILRLARGTGLGLFCLQTRSDAGHTCE